MAYEFRELDDKETKLLVDYGQRIMSLGVEKSKIQTERANSEIVWNTKVAGINAEIAKNSDAIKAIRAAGADLTFRAITDSEAKQVIDLTQRIEALKVELAKITKEKTNAEAGWQIRISNINSQISTISDSIAYMREATEI